MLCFSVTALAILLVEVILIMIAKGTHFFRSFLHVTDVIIIIVALVFELLIPHDTVAVIMFVLVWRIIRVAHGLFTSFELDHKRIHEEEGVKYESKLKNLEQLNNKLVAEIKALQNLN